MTPSSATRVLQLTAVLGAIVAVLPAGGCKTMESILADAEKPGARVVAARLAALDMNAASLEFDVEVTNPYDVSIPLVDLAFGLSSGGRQFLSGEAEAQGTIPARGSRVIAVPARVPFADLMSVVSSVRPGQVVPYEVDATVGVDAPALGRVEVPVRRSGELPVPAPPVVAVDRIDWETLSWDGATAAMHLSITNANDFPIDLSSLDYALRLAGADIVSTRVNQPTSFRKGQKQSLRVPVEFRPSSLGLAVFNILRGDGADYGLSGSIEAQTPFGPLSLPVNAGGRTRFGR
jgi:LEA14-like dessication related protein